MSAPMKPMKAMKATKQGSGPVPAGSTQIFIKPTPQGRRTSLVVKGSDTVADVKIMIAAVPNWNIEVHQQTLLFAGNQLFVDDTTLSSIGIGNGSIIKLKVFDIDAMDYWLNAD